MATRQQLNPPPLRKITDFKSKLTGGGARSNLFEVVLSFPDIAPADTNVLDKARFLVKGANLPASNVAPIDVPFRGRTLKVAGDRTFESWTVTVINDTDFAIRSAFENWMNRINRVSDNTGVTDPTAYTADAFVYQLDRDGSTLRAYHFYDIFPTSIGSITLDYGTSTIQEFPVEFQILWWEAVKGDSPAAGGQDIN
ncbi:tail tube [Synechococcus phage S-SRM01]|uniref:Tail tube monomer n=1 Tax=Synechococcus phage S-SRM01 TaxID=2781608 RepID=A0A879R375_9CAUD|nr:tail tube [Synechococcus phage S-SRM01]QPX48177.1 tail tube monomer [Synechococcus phage S-SRM01]